MVIEPTGLGHPAQILDHLQSPDFKKVLQLKAVITLIDPLAHWDLWNEVLLPLGKLGSQRKGGEGARPLLSGWLILYRGGGGGQRPKKSLCT